MKIKGLIVFVCLFLYLSGFTQEGVLFRALSLEEAQKEARAEKKLVFVDCYTSWCGPCKDMSLNVFPLAEAGKFFNSRFICVKFDMEKGEGVEIAKKYRIKVYPTFLMLTPEGVEQYRITGKMGLDELIGKVTHGLDEKNNLTLLAEAFNANKLGKEELYNYAISLLNMSEYKDAAVVGARLCSVLSDQEKLDARFWSIFSDYFITPITSEGFKFLLKHKPEFENLVGASVVNEKLYILYSNVIQSYIAGYLRGKSGNISQDSIGFVIGQIKGLNLPEKQQLLELKGELAKARCANDVNAMIGVAEQLLPLCDPRDVWPLATFFLTLNPITDAETQQRLKQLEDKFLARLPDEKMHGFIKDSFGKNKVRALEMKR